MNEYTASNGISVSRQPPVTDRGSWLMVDGHMTSPNDAQALREFFQKAGDESLERWRWPLYPEYVVYSGRRPILVLNELTGDTLRAHREDGYTDTRHGTIYNAAAAYFEAHPERKPWHDAKPGEVWVLTIDGGEQVVSVVQQYEKDFNPISHPIYATFANGSEHITDARKIWPEDAS